MDERQVVATINEDPRLKFAFKGIFNQKEHLPHPNMNSSSIYILYLKNNNSFHWFCCFSYNSKEVYLFDSMGDHRLHNPIISQLKNYYRKVTRLTTPIQGTNSQLCGSFVIHFLKSCVQGRPPFKYYKLLTKDAFLN